MRRRLSAATGRFSEQAEDLEMQALAGVLTRLQSDGPEGEKLASVRAYSIACAHTACDGMFRKNFPVRARLASQIRYVLKSQEGFEVWLNSDGTHVAGFAAWATGDIQPDSKRIALIREDLAKAIFGAFPNMHGPSTPLADCLERLFNWVGGPIELELASSVIAEFKNEKDPVRKEETPDSDYSALDFAADNQMGADTMAGLREYLESLWQEVKLLPTRQAQALLLNLRDNRGRGIIEFLLICGITDPTTLAATLAMTPEELADIWNELPWDDARIAAFLGCSTLDVSNLRSVARRRLLRRIEKSEKDV